MSLLGADVGGSGAKVAAFDAAGRMLAHAYEPYGQLRPRPGWLEFDLEAQWEALRRGLRRVAAEPGVRHDPPRSLSISVAGDAVVGVDESNRQIYPSIATPDERGREEGEWLAAAVGGAARLYQITGQPVDNMYALNRILWFREHMPEVYQRVWKWLCWHDFMVGKLGLPPTLDWSLAARSLGFDIGARRWSAEMLRVSQLSEDQLGTVVPAGAPIGPIPTACAEELGLPRGVLVVAGGFDQACAALGAGADRVGIASIGTGSVEAFSVPVARPVGWRRALALRRGVIQQVPHTAPNLYLALGDHFAAGTLLRWYRDTFAAEERQEAERLGQDAFDRIGASLPDDPTRLLVLPHFAGAFSPRRDPLSLGAILGMTFNTTRVEVARALLEGTAYELRRIVEFVTAQGVRVDELRVVGGGARSDAWVQIKADVLGRPIVRPAETEGGCLAGAMLGAVALGIHPDLRTAVEAMVRPSTRFDPHPRRVAAYERRYAIYRDLHPTLAPLSRRLATLDDEPDESAQGATQ